MATRAGKAFVDFEGKFDQLQKDAAGAVGKIGGHMRDGLGKAFNSTVAIGSTAFAIASAGAVGFLVDATKAAGRVAELNVVLDTLAKANGLSATKVHDTAAAVKKMGIETATAQGVTAAFIQSNLDLGKAADLARVAQDAAVISGKNSTDTLQGLMTGIQTQQVDLLRSNGIFINGQQALNDYAKAHHTTANALSATDKQQAFLNAVMQQGTHITGAYSAAMEQPGKQLRSMPRLFNDIAVNVGSVFQPAFSRLVTPIYELVKVIDKFSAQGTPLYALFKKLGDVLFHLVDPLGNVTTNIGEMIANMKMSDVDKFMSKLSSIGPVIGALGAAFGALGATKLPFIGEFASMLPGGPLLAGFGALIAMNPQLRSAFEGIFKQLMPVFQQLMSTVGTVLGQLAPVISSLVTALTPVLTTLAKVFGDTLVAIMPAVTQVATLLGKVLVQAVQALAPVIVEIAPLIADFLVQAIKALLPVLVALAPIIPALAKVFADLLRAVAPMLPVLAQLIVAVSPLLILMANLAALLIGALGTAISWIAQHFSALVPLILALAAPFVIVMGPIALLIGVIAGLGFAIYELITHFDDVKNAVMTVLQPVFDVVLDVVHAVGDAFQTVFGAIANVVGTVVNFISDHWKLLIAIFLPVLGILIDIVVTHFQQIKDFIEGVVGAIVGVVTGAFNAIAGPVKAAMDAVVGVVHAGIDAVVRFFTGLYNAIIGPLSAAATWLLDVGKKILEGLLAGIKWYWDNVLSRELNIAKKLLELLGDASKWLLDLGGKIVEGMFKGIGDKLGGAGGWIKDKFGGFVGKIGGFLGIGSPSRMMRDLVGVHLGTGVLVGLELGVSQALASTVGRIGDKLTEGLGSMEALRLQPELGGVAGLGGAAGGAPNSYNLTVHAGDVQIDEAKMATWFKRMEFLAS